MNKTIALLLAAAFAGCTTTGSDEGGKDSAEYGGKATRETSSSPGPSGSPGESDAAESMQRAELPRADEFERPGFAVYEREGRLWVFRDGSEEHEDFLTTGEPAKRVTRVGTGPDGRTLIGAESDTLTAYEAAHRYGGDAWYVDAKDGRLWVFRTGSEELIDYLSKGEPAKRVTVIGAGPNRSTVIGPDRATVQAFVAPVQYGLPGYVVKYDDGRLWVFEEDGDAYADYLAHGEPAKRVTLVGAGPDGRTLLGADRQVLKDYAAHWKYDRPGFTVYGDDGRLWVFEEGSAAHAMFSTKGEPAKRVTVVGAGPDGMTLLGADRETLDDYLRERGVQE